MVTNPHPHCITSRNQKQTLNYLRNSTTLNSSPSKITFYSYSFTDSILLHNLYSCKPQYTFTSFIFPLNKNLNKSKEYITSDFKKSNRGRYKNSIDISNKEKVKKSLYSKIGFTNGRSTSVKLTKKLSRNHQNNIVGSCTNTKSKNDNVFHNDKNRKIIGNNTANLCLLERYNMLKNRNGYKDMKMRRKKKFYNS